MGIIITDNRTLVDEADATTGWTASDPLAVFTSAPDPVEASGCLGQQVSNSLEDAYHTLGASVDLTDTLVYGWMLPGGVLDTRLNGGVQVQVGDGTDRVGYHVAGSDAAGFRHNDGPVVWQAFVIDLGNPPADTTVFSGTLGNLTLTAITQIGGAFKTLAKSVGGVENCFYDVYRFGNGGLTITGGSATIPGLFSDIADSDRSTNNLTAYGIERELGAGLFGLQGQLKFGDSAGTASSYFEDSSGTASVVVFEDRGLNNNKYGLSIKGNGTGHTRWLNGKRDGIGLGSNGTTFLSPSGVSAFFDCSDSNVDSFAMYGTIINGYDKDVSLSRNKTNVHEIFSTSFVSCGIVDIGYTEFKNNSFVGSVDSIGACHIRDTANVLDLTFTSAGTGHAILIDSAGTVTFDNFTYAGYAESDGTTGNEVFYNNSGGLVIINVVGGDIPSVRNGASASTTIVASVNVTLTGMKDNTEVRVYTNGTTTEVAGIENATAGTTDDREFTFSASPNDILDIKAFNINWIADDLIAYVVPGNNTEIPIAQRIDRVYANP